MATYDLEEQEKIDEIKTWWKQYGNRLINLLLAIVLVAAAWQAWNWYQRRQSGEASIIYSVLQQAAQAKDVARINATSGELLEKFPNSSYAPLGALISAKAMLEAGDAKAAKLQLAWVSTHGKDEVRDLARLRLAAILLDEKAYDEALKSLDGSVSAGFEARFADTRGDVLLTQGKKTEAISAYQAALTRLTEQEKSASDQGGSANSVFREVIQLKIDANGGAK